MHIFKKSITFVRFLIFYIQNFTLVILNKKPLRTIIAVLFALLASIQNGFASTWSVTVSGNTFTITRSGYTGAETVYYRTVDLTAFAGQHYTTKSGSLSFGANDSQKTVTVTETAPGATTAYAFQRTAERAYRFEVLDEQGFELAHCDRSREVGVIVDGKPFKGGRERLPKLLRTVYSISSETACAMMLTARWLSNVEC